MALNWKVAAAGGAVLGLGVGGFTIAGADDTDVQPVRDVDLQSARDSISSLSSPVRIPTTTTAADAVGSVQAPATPPPAVAQSDDSPVAAPAPAPAPPAPAFDDSASPVQPSSGGSDDSASAAASS